MPHWTRKRTWPDDDDAPDDWTVLRDGLVVGRVLWDRSQNRSEKWLWAVLTLPTHQGHTETMEEGLEKVRRHASETWGHEPYGDW